MTVTLSTESQKAIDHWIAKFPADKKQSAVIAALHIVQNENGGWISEPLMDAVAEYLEMPPASVYEVATFYTMFELSPTGKYVLKICNSVSCMLRGADELVAHFKKTLNIDVNETTEDGLFTLREVECLAACTNAPAMQVGKDYYERMTPEKADVLINQLGGRHEK